MALTINGKKLNDVEAMAYIQGLEKAVETAQAATARTGNISVRFNALGSTLPGGGTGKGNVSIMGMGRFPFTFYPAQVPKIAALLPAIAGTILANADGLAWQTPAEKESTLAWARTLAPTVAAAQTTAPAVTA